ncbi:hypothetical protein MNEG_5713 [Monoraphidium neglectum]|uniref:Uncharacterized protein n=1 Tax=Monoraphidium neglectum TaxID=145388 RepID=A0A0D2MP20_9CHLO|nr:hypothetical protein MNEG_5713 [Monoraphidium neglectum]KIZ02252.1 hypothetical protein MNEG_5713 [Monoraphidium neglectum]|eukprot:XP_013901271.1 hypothetical protein MNEG_5713 [Monoraphidium neglectum]
MVPGVIASPSLDALRMMQLQQLRLQAQAQRRGSAAAAEGITEGDEADAEQESGQDEEEEDEEEDEGGDTRAPPYQAQSGARQDGDTARQGGSIGGGIGGGSTADGDDTEETEEREDAAGASDSGDWGPGECVREEDSVRLSFTQENVIDPQQHSFSTVM